MAYQTQPLKAVDAASRAILRRALAVYSDDVAGDLHVLVSDLEAGQKRGLLLMEGQEPVGVALWGPEAAGPEYVAVDLLHSDQETDEAAEALVAGLWAVLLADSVLLMFSVRVRDSRAVRAALMRQEAVPFTRQMMVRDLMLEALPAVSLPEGYALARWEEAHQPQVEAIAMLVQQNSVDAVIMPDALPERMPDALRRIRAGTYPDSGPCIPDATLVLLDGARTVCGYIATVDMGMLGFVMDVAVHPDHRRRGLARQLMLAASRAVQDAGFGMLGLAVTADNPASRLYASMGFRVAQAGETAVWWRDGRQLAWR